MRQLYVHLITLAIILTVIFASGNENVSGYLTQDIFKGQTVFVQDQETAYINDEYTQVVHTGLTWTDAFSIEEVIDLNGTEYLLLDHSVSGGFGKPSYTFSNISSASAGLEENITLGVWEIDYVGSYIHEDRDTLYLYQYSNLTVALSQDDFAIIQIGNSSVLLQQTLDTVTAHEIETPFSIGVEEIGGLLAILGITAIIGYWVYTRKLGGFGYEP